MRRENREFILFMLPSMILLTVVVIYPLTYSFYMSLFRWHFGGKAPIFIGLDNYIALIQSTDFLFSLRTSVIFTVLSVVSTFFLGLGLALLLNSVKKGRIILVTLLVLPVMLPSVISAGAMAFIFNPSVGVLNNLISSQGLPRVDWYSTTLALFTVLAADVWRSTPLLTLIFIAALSTLPRAPIEAAMIDGASKLQTLRLVILPMLSWHILFVISIRVMDAFRIFDEVFVLTGGGPGIATQTITVLNYQVEFVQLELGMGSAIGWVTLLILLVVIIPFTYFVMRRQV